MSTPQEVSADELLHKTVAEQMESAKLEKDVVVLNENNLQEELVASKSRARGYNIIRRN